MGEYPVDQSSWGRTRQDTISAFHTLRFWLFELCTFAGLTILVLLWVPTSVSDWGKIVYQVLVPLVGVFAGLAGVFLISLFVAPYRQRNQARKLIAPSEGEVNDAIQLLKAETLTVKNNEEEERLYSFDRVFLAIVDQLSVGVPLNHLEGQIREGLHLDVNEGWFFPYENKGITHLIGVLYQNALVDRRNEEYQHMVGGYSVYTTSISLIPPPKEHLSKGTVTKYYLSPLGRRVIRQLQSTVYKEGSQS